MSSSGGSPLTPPTDEIVSALLTNPASDATAALLAAMNSAYGNALLATPGVKYKVVAGVLRNDGSGTNYWQPIVNATHGPTGISSVSTTGTTDGVITINYAALNAKKVVSFVAGPDEQLAKAGFAVGASVDVVSASLSLSQSSPVANDFISYNGSSWVSTNGVFTPSYTAGVLTLSHPAIPLPSGTGVVYDVSVVERGGTYVCCLSSEASVVHETQVKIEFRDWAGTLQTVPNTNMKAFVSHGGGTRKVNPQSTDTAAYPSSNIWFIGLFEV